MYLSSVKVLDNLRKHVLYEIMHTGHTARNKPYSYVQISCNSRHGIGPVL